MKGKLLLKNKQWIVQYLEAQDAHYMCSQMTDVKELPLHPDDYAIASLLSVKNGVEFDKVDTLGQVYYAKLIQPSNTPMLDSLAKAIREMLNKFEDDPKVKEETWDDIFMKYSSEHRLHRQDYETWLKQNYNSPKKK